MIKALQWLIAMEGWRRLTWVFWKELSLDGGQRGAGLHLPALWQWCPGTKRRNERRRWSPAAARTLWPGVQNPNRNCLKKPKVNNQKASLSIIFKVTTSIYPIGCKGFVYYLIKTLNLCCGAHTVGLGIKETDFQNWKSAQVLLSCYTQACGTGTGVWAKFPWRELMVMTYWIGFCYFARTQTHRHTQ